MCSDATCDAGGSPGPLGTPWSNDPSESYLRSVRSVAIGVGIIALIFFTIAFLIYTKKGWKSWEQYRSRKNGLQYKYRPGDSRRNLPGPFPPSGPSPGEAHTIEGFDSAYRPPGSSFLDVGFGSQLDEDSVLDSEMSYPIPQHQKLPTLKTSAHLDVPPRRPPRPYTPPVESKSGIISVQCDSGKYEGDLEEKQLADERIIDESEAILVGHTFRNALRVACEDNNSGDQSDVKALDDPKNSTLSELESSCSPVLSRLQCV